MLSIMPRAGSPLILAMSLAARRSWGTDDPQEKPKAHDIQVARQLSTQNPSGLAHRGQADKCIIGRKRFRRMSITWSWFLLENIRFQILGVLESIELREATPSSNCLQVPVLAGEPVPAFGLVLH